MSPRVSVILSCFNCETYIAEAIDSVLSQTYQDYEIIVINDGSTDKSGEIIEYYANKHQKKIRYIVQENQGQEAALNHGFSLAQGEYLAFIDSDDIWYPDKLVKQVNILSNDPGKRVGLVYTYIDHLNADPTRRSRNAVTIGVRGQAFKGLFTGAFATMSSIIVPRYVFVKVGGFNPRFSFCCDYDLMLRIAAAGYDFEYIPEVLTTRRIHSGNKTRSQMLSNINNREMLLEIAGQYAEKIREYNVDVDYRMALLDLQLAWHYFVTGNLKGVRRTLIPVLRHYPSLVLRSKRYMAYYLLSFFPASWVKRLKTIPFLAPIFKGK
ncbi:glycosyltransferase family 2 protein [Candidatus Neomarinimicrobiota bacterium]